MRRIFATLFFMLLASSGFAQSPPTAESCARLGELAVSDAKIISARKVSAGAFAPVSQNPEQAGASIFKALPAFCRVQAAAVPSNDSDIQLEVWMPLAGWNGKFQAVGNGGFAGEINYREMAIALAEGYATASTDTGHSGSAIDAKWALRHPEKIVDFGYRGIHEMTRVSKTVVKGFFGGDSQKSYFAGCSNGGRQALMEAQRYPEDYDGILAGAPANYWTHLLTSAVWDAQAITVPAASYIPTSKVPAIGRAVNAACDAADGVTDGIVNDPRKCHFHPRTLLCKGAESDNCLTKPQVVALEKLYDGARDSHGKEIFPGFLPGAEDGPGGWSVWITGSGPGKGLLFFFGSGFFANMVYGKPDWGYKDANLDELVKLADANFGKTLSATEGNLKPFTKRGGKLLIYHGWNDPAISALNTIDYYKSVVDSMGDSDTAASVRLFLAPGMQHCGGGPGPDSFGQVGSTISIDAAHSAQLALEQWVEKGIAPSEIIATKYASESDKTVKMTRPLCAYPRVAKYKGSGKQDDAGSFSCAEER